MCARCYRLSRIRLVICPDCGEERPVYFANRCERCKHRAAARAGACADCGKQVTRLWSGRCRSCDVKSREITGVDGIKLTGLRRRRFGRAKPAGPYLIAGRASGLALDSTRETSGDIHPVMWEPNGQPWQRWRLEPAPDGIGFLINSPNNGSFLTLSEEAREHLDEPWHPWLAPREGNHSQQWIFSLPHGNI